VSETRVIEVDATSDSRWDAYVRGHPRATANHLSAWARIMAAAYGFEPVYLALEDGGGEVAGVMPIVYARGILSGPRLTSLPALRWAGPLASSFEDEVALLEAACERVQAGKPRRLGLVTSIDGYDEPLDGIEKSAMSPSWRLALPDDPDRFRRNLKQRSKGHYYAVRKAIKAGVTVRRTDSTADLRRFYRLYLATMRRHRSLPRPFRKFSVAQDLLGADVCRLYVAELDGRIVGGLVCHFFNGMVEIMYNASDERYLSARPNQAVYEHAIVAAIEEGLDSFDFGGAWPHESLASFKQRWGTEPLERFSYSFPSRGESGAGASALSRAKRAGDEGGGEAMVSRIWGRTPLPLTRLAGEVLWRYA
jgi:CelD/BcsL family acetyltransferase involved in cellulose biosynthesis